MAQKWICRILVFCVGLTAMIPSVALARKHACRDILAAAGALLVLQEVVRKGNDTYAPPSDVVYETTEYTYETPAEVAYETSEYSYETPVVHYENSYDEDYSYTYSASGPVQHHVYTHYVYEPTSYYSVRYRSPSVCYNPGGLMDVSWSSTYYRPCRPYRYRRYYRNRCRTRVPRPCVNFYFDNRKCHRRKRRCKPCRTCRPKPGKVCVARQMDFPRYSCNSGCGKHRGGKHRGGKHRGGKHRGGKHRGGACGS